MPDKTVHYPVVLYLAKCCQKLELNDTTYSTACVLYHRFFQQCDVEAYDLFTVAATAIYLATKVEEQHVRLRDIVNICHRTKHIDKPYLELDAEFWKLRDTIASCELLMMRVLKFQVTFVHPHKYMLHYLLSLSQMFHRKEWSHNLLSDVAWSILKDSFIDCSCLEFLPQVHAIAIIHLALQCCKVKVPFSENLGIPWWKILYQDCSASEIAKMQSAIVQMYNILDRS